MVTVVSKTIGSTGDYATWALWEAACPSNLVTADQIWEGQGQNQEFVVAGTVVTVSGMTTDSTRFVRLTTAPGASFADNANKLTNKLGYYASQGCALRASADYNDTIVIAANYTQVTKLQAKALDNGRAISLSDDTFLVDQCIAEAGTHMIQGAGVGTKTIKNTLCVRTTSGGNYGLYLASGTIIMLNCTVARASNLSAANIAIFNDYATSTIKNCSVFGFSTFSAVTPTVSNNNASDLATVPGSSAQASLTFSSQFEQTSNASSVLDLRTKTGSGQIGNGADLSGSGVTVDIVGTARTAPYDIGVWAAVAAIPVNATPGSGSIALAGQTVTVTAGVDVTPGTGAIVMTGQSVDVTAGVDVAPGSGEIAILGRQVVVSNGILPPSGITMFAGISAGAGICLDPGVSPFASIAVP